MSVTPRPYFLAGKPEHSSDVLPVTDKWSGEVHASVCLADASAVDRAIDHAVRAKDAMRKLAAYERRDVLLHCAARFEARKAELAESLCAEAGKPIKDARGEVVRLVDTFRIAAEEATRIAGEVLPMDVTPRAKGYVGYWKRVPVGVCSFITPFNFPLNLVAHKVAPAIAAGCPFVLKPASATPLGALIVAEVLAETSLPEGAFSVLPTSRGVADVFVTDARIACLSFTGSAEVGWDMKARAGKKRVVLELGGNAAALVDEDADLEDATDRIVIGAFYQSGQSCISVQRIVVHEAVYDVLIAKLVEKTKALRAGDPHKEETFVGPLIAEKDAVRLERWITDAVKGGAKLLCGGTRKGALLEPTLVADAPPDCDLVRKEAFGPVAVISKATSFDDALRQVNDSDFGLQAGVFTRDLYKAHRAWDELHVGGVLIGDVPSFRVDHMPYGGVKDSGFGREGVRWAIEDYTEVRLMAARGAGGR